MTSILITIFSFLAAIAILVAFHEFGHFWVARRLGVKVLRFSVGFGRKLISWTGKDGTEYVIAAIPLGGYVKMLDEREDNVQPEEQGQAFNCKPLWVRTAVVAAGPIFNFIFAILAYWLMFMIGITGTIPKVGTVVPSSIAAQAGVSSGDQILTVDHQKTRTWSDVAKTIMPRLGDSDYLRFELKADNGEHKIANLNLIDWTMDRENPDLFNSLGITPYFPEIPPIVHETQMGEPAVAAGFLAGDIVLSVDGKEVKQWLDFTQVVEKSANQSLDIVVQREEGYTKLLKLVPRQYDLGNNQSKGYAGLLVKIPELDKSLQWVERFNPWDAFTASVQKTADFIVISFKMIGKMVVGDIGLYNLSGPITIAQGAGVSASIGFEYYLNFLAMISISLGVINLLPIPILDGGHLLYYAIEFFTRKPVSEKVQIFGFKLGMMFLIFIMTVAFYNDLLRMF
tara:strand:+ start:154018 stop:155379 length:1362 start_codon:yes stop_codon:yes gene_type:complete